MSEFRKGKIARLPPAVRQELNERLQDGAAPAALLAWLNARPEVRAFLAAEFAGQPITKHNLSDWRQGGFADWLTRADLQSDSRQITEAAVELQESCAADAAPGPAPDLAAEVPIVLAARLARSARQSMAAADPVTQRSGVFKICRLVAGLRRSEHQRQRAALVRQNELADTGEFDAATTAQFWAWIAQPENLDKAYGHRLTRHEQNNEYRKIFGMRQLSEEEDVEAKGEPLGPDDLPLSRLDAIRNPPLGPFIPEPGSESPDPAVREAAECRRRRRVLEADWARYNAIAKKREAKLAAANYKTEEPAPPAPNQTEDDWQPTCPPIPDELPTDSKADPEGEAPVRQRGADQKSLKPSSVGNKPPDSPKAKPKSHRNKPARGP